MKLDRPVSYSTTKWAAVTLLLHLLLLLDSLINCQCFTTTANTFRQLRKYHAALAPLSSNNIHKHASSNNMSIHNVHSNSIIQSIACSNDRCGLYSRYSSINSRCNNQNSVVLQMSSKQQNQPEDDFKSKFSNQQSHQHNHHLSLNINIDLTSIVVNTLSILGLSSALLLFWSDCSLLLTKCSPASVPIYLEESAYGFTQSSSPWPRVETSSHRIALHRISHVQVVFVTSCQHPGFSRSSRAIR